MLYPLSAEFESICKVLVALGHVLSVVFSVLKWDAKLSFKFLVKIVF